MDLKLIRNLVRIMERGEVSELAIEDEKTGIKICLKRGQTAAAPGPVVMVPGAGHGPAAAPPGLVAEEEEEEEDRGRPAGVEEIPSPMVGTFYRAASPGADAFVDAGTSVEEDTVICIIEAMKVMNEIKAEMRGEIVEILVENGDPVEFGQPLFLIKTS